MFDARFRDQRLQTLLAQVEREDFQQAETLFADVLCREPDYVDALVGQGFLCANRGEYAEALAICDQARKIDDLCPQVYLLRGLIQAMDDDSAGAAEEYRKALLLDMNFIMPHYYLSTIFARQGRLRDARRELRNTLRLLENLPDEALVPYSGGLTREVFLHLCRDDLAAVPAESE